MITPGRLPVSALLVREESLEDDVTVLVFDGLGVDLGGGDPGMSSHEEQ